jgi:hypothetical protein
MAQPPTPNGGDAWTAPTPPGQPAPLGVPAPAPAGWYGTPAPWTAPPPQAPAALAHIDLTVQGNAFTASFLPPRVWINGWPIPPAYGRRTLDVPAGLVRVDVEARWWRTYGQAMAVFTAAPGQMVPVFYAAPHHVFSRGAIGHVRQRRPGVGWLIAVLAVCAAALIPSVIALLS